MSLKLMFGWSIVTMLALNVGVRSANAQSEVFGNGIVEYLETGSPYWVTKFSHFAINAWLDEDGVAHGHMAWTGDTNRIPVGRDVQGNGRDMLVGGLSAPWNVEVTDIYFFGGNSAWVVGVATTAPNPEEIGGIVGVYIVDNEGTGEPDLMNFNFIDAGDFKIR